MRPSQVSLKEAVGVQGARGWGIAENVGKAAVCIALDDTTHGTPQALHGFHRHGQGRGVHLAMLPPHCRPEDIAARKDTTRLDPPSEGIRWRAKVCGRPGERLRFLCPHTDQNQGPRHSPQARVEGHGEDGVTPAARLVLYGCQQYDPRSWMPGSCPRWPRGQGGRTEE